MCLKKKKEKRKDIYWVSQSYIAYIELKQNYVLDLIHVIWSVLKRNINPQNIHKEKPGHKQSTISKVELLNVP